MNGRRGGRQTAAYLHPDFFPAKIFTVPCVNLFSVSDIYFQTRIADKDLLFLRRLLGTRQAYKWGVVHLTEVQPVKGAEALDLEATCGHIWPILATHFGPIFCNMSEFSNDTMGPTLCHLATFPSVVSIQKGFVLFLLNFVQIKHDLKFYPSYIQQLKHLII